MTSFSVETYAALVAATIRPNLDLQAVLAEYEQNLSNLQLLIDSGEWVEDDRGNVFPAELSEIDRQEIRDRAEFSIFDQPPRLEGSDATLDWRAIGSLICDAKVVVSPLHTTDVKLSIDQSVVTNSVLSC